MALDNAPVDGGDLPNANVTDLSLSLGDINQTTGACAVARGRRPRRPARHHLRPGLVPDPPGPDRLPQHDEPSRTSSRSTRQHLRDGDRRHPDRDQRHVHRHRPERADRLRQHGDDHPARPHRPVQPGSSAARPVEPSTTAANQTDTYGTFSVQVNPAAFTVQRAEDHRRPGHRRHGDPGQHRQAPRSPSRRRSPTRTPRPPSRPRPCRRRATPRAGRGSPTSPRRRSSA